VLFPEGARTVDSIMGVSSRAYSRALCRRRQSPRRADEDPGRIDGNQRCIDEAPRRRDGNPRCRDGDLRCRDGNPRRGDGETFRAGGRVRRTVSAGGAVDRGGSIEIDASAAGRILFSQT